MAEIDDFLAESKKSGGFFGIGGSKPVSKTSEVDEFLAQKRGEGGSNILRRAVVDPLVGVAQGTLVGLPEAAVGLANIPTLGGAGKMVENVARGIGVPTFDEANERFKSLLSPETREAERKVAEAEGFVGTLKAGLANPSAPVQTIMQSIPAMFGGAAAGRAIVTALGKAPLSGKALTEALTAAGGPSSAAGKALLKSNMAKAVTAGAVGEGLVSAGQNVEQLRQEMTSGLITPQQAMIMSGSGFATGLITKMSGGLASRLKIVDVDTLLQGVNTAGHIELKILPVLKALAWSAISEGAIEELPQSAQETFASNVAAGRPPFDGVPEAAAMGLLAGVGMGLGGGGGAVIRQYIQDQDPNNRKINQLMEEIGGEELEAVKVPGFITGSEAATVPITPGEQALPEEAMVEDQAGNMLEEELAAIEAPPLEELSGEVQAIEAAPAEVAPIGTPLEALPQIEAAPAIEAAPLQPALEAPVAPVEAPAIQEAASIAPHPEIAPAAIEAAMPPAAEAPVIPPAPQAIPAPAASVPGIPDVFMQMPMETLQQMADNGVAGAKAALPIRLQQAAAPIAPPVPPVPQQAAPAIPAAQPPVPAKAAEVSTFKRKKDFSYSGEYSFTVNGENWKAYRDADAGNLHAWFAAKEGDDFPRQSSLYSKKELIDRIESGEYYKGGPDYVPSAGTPAPAPPAPVAKSSATRKQLKEMGEDPDYLLKEIRGADDLQGVDEQNYNQAIARGESGSIEISQAESVRKLRLAEATKEISKKRKTPQAPAPAPPAAPAPPVTSAAEAKTRIAGKKVSAEAKALTGQIAQVEAALADREKKIKAGEKAKKDMSSAKKAQSVQQHYLAKIKKDLADLSAKEAAPKKTKSPVQDEIDAAEDSVKLLEKELTKAQKDYDEAVRLARPKKEIKILGNTRDDIKKEIADVKKELSRLTKKPSFTREDQAAGAGLLAERAQSIVDKVLGFLKNPPPVRVLADINTFINSDDPMGKRLKAYMVENEMLDEDGGDSRTVGFFWEGTTYIVAGNISTPQGVVNTLAHELTHNGLGRLLDSQKGMPGIGSIRLKRDILMDKIYHAHTADIKEIAATTHQHLDLSKAEGRRQAAEEWVCNQSYEAQPKWYDKLVALFHDAMRALGINTKITDAEVRVVLGDAFKEFGYRAGEPQSGGPADSPLFQISKAKALRAVPYKILRPDEIPEKTQKAYKLMKVFDGVNLLFPLYADAPTGEQPRGFKLNEWHKAEVANIKMATRPGLHAVDLPIFSQGKVGGLKDNIKRVWVEVLMPAMNQKTQAEADATELLGNGQREGIRKRLIGVDEAYNFKTSNNAQGAGSWPVAGSMNPARILHDKEVAQILKAAGKSEFVENSMTGISNTTAQMLNDQLMGSGEPQFSRTQINTPAFKNWFGSSKVVNKNGEPLVVYHGTRTSPVKFKKIMGMFGHFGTIAAANDKLEWDAHRPGEHAVMPVYLSLQNPVRMEDVHFDEYGTMAEDLVESGALSKKDLPLAWEKRYGNLDTKYITQLIDVLKSKGYDGIVYENRVESPGEDSWIPFAATQIKSATGNVGAFAKANPDIRFARGTGFENRNYGSRVLSGEESVPGSVPPFLSDVATYLEDISKKDGRVDHRTATRKQKEQIVGAVKEMLRASVKRYPESLGWYKKDLETTMDILTDIYPELKKPSNHFRMRLAIALSSNGNDTTTNIEIARKIYESFRDSGIMESDVKASRAKAIRESLRLADILRGTFKSEKAFEDWLLGSAYIGDLQSDVAARLKITRKEAAGIVGGTEGQDTFLPRAIIFGPKVGVFFTNLSGDFSQITMDRWFMRTMGRLTGILVEGGKKSEVIAQRERFTEAMKASPGGVRLSQIQEDLYSSGRSIDKAAAKISKLSMKDNFRELLNNVPGGEELRHAANNRNKYINGAMPIDSPSSGAHRQWLRDIVNEAREGLEKEGLSYENADIQAAIWIGEKELYKTFGVKGKRGDYYSTGAEVLYERVHGRPSGRHAGIAGRVVERGRGKLGQTLPLFSRTPDNIIEKIKDLALNSPDGFTINVADGTAQTTGYAVAPSKLTETRVKKLTERNLTEFIDRYGDVFEKDTRAFLGGWHDSNTKEIVLDISFVVDDLADALYIADIGDQIAIFHLDNFEEIGREDGIKGLKEAGVYSQGRRDELGGIQESLHKAIQGSGVAGGRAGEPSFTRTAGRVRTAGQRVERKGVTRSSGQELIDQGTHYSNQQRGRLDSKFYGTGLADAASRRLPSDPKSPLRQRIHFYYDPGTGMPKAEVGVGTYAHNADLSQYKIYNLSSGKIKVDRVEGEHVLNTFEKAIMKAGFDGFSSPDYGVVVLIGKRTVPVEPQFSRISSQEDAAYLKAVESGDMEIAQRMVDEAAKAAGYNIGRMYNGVMTREGAEPGYIYGKYHNVRASGGTEWFFFTPNKDVARQYSFGGKPFIRESYLASKKTLDLMEENGRHFPAAFVKMLAKYGIQYTPPLASLNHIMNEYGEMERLDTWEYISNDTTWRDISGVAKAIEDAGYDSIKFKDNTAVSDSGDRTAWTVRNPNQVKSADPVTHDDKGNIVPLSQRFNPEEVDIRFQRKAQTNTPEFKKWFGNSKVVDENGEPLVVYHGTTSKEDFTVFRPSSELDIDGERKGDIGSHFGTWGQADARVAGIENARIGEYYLNIKNPLEMSDLGDWGDIGMLKEYLTEANEGPFTNKEFAKFKNAEDVKRGLINKGYDGIQYENQFENGDDGNISYIAFSPTQIKSATGNVGTFDETNPDIRFSRVSEAENSAYLKAVEADDIKTAQAMVDEAAKAAGYNVEAWHGGAKGINEFVPSVEGMYGAGIYTGGNEDYITKEFASQGQWLYGKFVPASKVYHVYLKMDNPLTVVTPVDVVEAVDGKVAAKEMSDKHGGPYELILDGGYTRDLQKKGYDGIIADNEWGRENIVFNPNQIKSADAITYNDKGNVTPLSERFSEESPDIRFSRTEEEAARKAGAEFSGFYETPAFGNKPARKIPTYNDPETGATFALNKGETIEQGLARKRAEFKKAADRPGAETVTEPSESTAAPAISDRVLFSIAAGASVPPGNDATWNAPVKSAMSSLWYTLVDKHADLRDVTTAIEKFSGTIGDVVNASLKETLFSGRVAKRVENYLEGELRPVLKELSNKNIDLSDFEEYLHFRHAEEANDYVKTLVDDKGKVVGMQDGGSGKTYQQIKDYFAGLDKGLAGRMESVAVKVDAMTRENARLMAEYRLESQATIDKWFGTYQHYVPLFREHVSEARMGTGTGLTVTGSITRKRKGSEKSVVNVLANIANQRERVIASGEKNIIATALYGLAKMHPNAEFWRVIKPGVKKVLDLKTKEMIWTPDFDYKKKTNVVMSRQFDKDGNIVERGIEFSIENERARRMADSIRNIDMDTLGLVLGTSAKVTRFIASMNTQYNPVFGVTNFVRDVGTAMFNLTTTPIAGRQKEMMGHALPALKGIYEAIRAQRAGKPFSSEWAKLFDEFQTHGGQTGYRDLYKTTDERSRRLEREINMMKGGTALKAGSAVMGWLSDYNTAMENAIRLSAYKVGIDNGMSKDQSAAMAKSLTVNFNRKGQIATQAGSLYAFFNASAQGISKVYETLTGPAGKRVIAGGLLFGVMQAAVLAAAGMGDDEPPEFVQEKNIVIPISGGKYITIPMPLGFNVLPNIGRMSAQFAMSGFERPFDRMANLFGVILDGFNPLGASKTLLQTISPTPIDPLVALAENKDWTGKPIYREDFSSLHPTPGFTRTKDTATWGGKGLAWGLNMLTGGTRATPGFFSPTPDQIDYLFGQATGGVGRETAKLQQTAAALATGDEVPAYKIPLGSRFFGSTTGGPYEATKYYNNLKMMNQHEDEIKDLKKHREPIMEYMADNPKAKLWTLSNKTESTINKLKKRKQDMIARGAKGESIKTIDALIATHMKRFNDTIAAAK